MTAEALQIANLVLNVPMVLAIARLWWLMERRIYRIELKLGLAE